MPIQKTRDDIINYALTLVGAKAAGEDALTEDVTIAAEALNDMVQAWQETGVHLWNRNFATLFAVSGQRRYQLGGTGADLAIRDDVTTPTVTVAIVGSTNVVTVSDTTSFTVGQDANVLQDDGTIATRNVAAITPTTAPAGTLTLNSPVTNVAVGNIVFTDAARVPKPLRVPTARREQVFSGSTQSQEIPMVQMGRVDYEDLPNKETSGTPVQFYYDPKIDFGEMYLWPVPDNDTTRINFTYYEPIDIFSDATTAADFPNEWVAALKYNLAVQIAPLYDAVLSPITIGQAERLLTASLTWDQGDEPVHFTYSPTRWR